MSDKNTARRAHVEVSFAGVDITKSIKPYFNSLTFTDNEEDEPDDLSLRINDRDDVWLTKWLNEIVDAAASAPAVAPAEDNTGGDWAIGDSVVVTGRPQYSSYGNGNPGAMVTNHSGKITYLNLKSGVPYPIHVDYLGWYAESQVTKEGAAPAESATASSVTGLKIQAVIVAANWKNDGKDKSLDCGEFELDSVDASGPPNTVDIKATGLPYSAQIRQTEKSRAWEAYNLSGIAKEMAAKAGMTCMYLSASDPFYTRVEQAKTSDIELLKRLCHDAGISLKATNNIIVCFDQAEYEAKPAVLTVKRGSGTYTKWKLRTGETRTKYASCRVSYTDPASGRSIEATVYVEDYDAKKENNQQLEITAKVASAAEAKVLAEKKLRLYNKHAKTASLTFPGNPALCAGLTVELVGWGMWSGKYIISKAVHTVGNGGYTTQVELRRVLEGY